MKKQLIPFLMAGDPHLEATEVFAKSLIDVGVSSLELGIAFSDPLADGPIIQRASARALQAKTSLTQVLKLSERLVKYAPHLKIILFSYFNPLLSYGLANYARDAAQAGVSASLCVDLAFEESAVYQETHRAHGLGTVFLASPTTEAQRLQKIAAACSDFMYYVSRAGVTGESAKTSETLTQELQKVKSLVSKPLAVGFGISTPEQAGFVARHADHVVIGSRFIKMIEESHSVEMAAANLAAFAKSCLNQIHTLEKIGVI